MTDALVQFLRDRFDEDYAVAKRVESSWRQVGETGVIVASDGDRAEECANGNWTGIAEHIVRHDPARVLREIEGKRQILDRVVPRMNEMDDQIDGEWGLGDGPEEYESEVLLRLLALPYDDHEAYREEWRP